MQTFFLKFADEAEAVWKLADYRGTDEAGNGFWMTAGVDYALDVVGVIHKPTGVMLPGEGGVSYPELEPVEGFHVNLAIAELPEALMPFAVTPDHPTRVFA